MPYLGNDLFVAQPSYRNIDDISGSFDNTTTSFALQVGGVAPVPFPINSNQCLISVAGVVQRPDDSGTEGFRISGGNIIFSSAPNTGDDFFGVILAGADYVNVGVLYPSGSAAAPSITFESDTDTGIYNPSANALGIATNGVLRLFFSSGGLIGFNQATPATTIDLSGNYGQSIVAVPALDIDCSAGNYFTKTINGNSTFTVSNVPASRAYSFTLELTHTSGTVTWFSGVEWPGGTAPTLTTGKTHLFMFVTDDGGTRWRGSSLVDYTN